MSRRGERLRRWMVQGLTAGGRVRQGVVGGTRRGPTRAEDRTTSMKTAVPGPWPPARVGVLSGAWPDLVGGPDRRVSAAATLETPRVRAWPGAWEARCRTADTPALSPGGAVASTTRQARSEPAPWSAAERRTRAAPRGASCRNMITPSTWSLRLDRVVPPSWRHSPKGAEGRSAAGRMETPRRRRHRASHATLVNLGPRRWGSSGSHHVHVARTRMVTQLGGS